MDKQRNELLRSQLNEAVQALEQTHRDIKSIAEDIKGILKET